MTTFTDRVRAAADGEGRLPLPQQAMEEIFPFEPESLVVEPLDADVVPEPPRDGEDDRPCWRCSEPEADAIRGDQQWVRAGTGRWGSSPTLLFHDVSGNRSST